MIIHGGNNAGHFMVVGCTRYRDYWSDANARYLILPYINRGARDRNIGAAHNRLIPPATSTLTGEPPEVRENIADLATAFQIISWLSAATTRCGLLPASSMAATAIGGNKATKQIARISYFTARLQNLFNSRKNQIPSRSAVPGSYLG